MENKGFVWKLLNHFAQADEKLTAFSIYDGTQQKDITYHQFLDDILNTAGYFAENQISGKHIAIVGASSYQWIVVFFAVMASGNVVVPMNQLLPMDILQWQCKKSDIDMICCDDNEMMEGIGGIPVICFDRLYSDITLSLHDLCFPCEEKTILMMFTSGTTGRSKAVSITARNLSSSVVNLLYAMKQEGLNALPGMERLLIIMPLFHVAAIRAILVAFLQLSTLCFGRGAKYVFMDMPILNPTHVPMVPAMIESICKILKRTPNQDRHKIIGNGLKIIGVGGAAPQKDCVMYLVEQGMIIHTIYGMTETAGDGTWGILTERRSNMLGYPCGNMQCKIQNGEILLKNPSVMKGYYKDREETEKVIEDGWIHTGDMGYCDEDGYYYITGRKKNVIILSNGENVNPEEIEATLGDCGAIEECLVYSDGKGICADVYAPDRNPAVDFIRAYNENMPMYRQIYKVNYTEEPLEKTGSGKIKRKENK